MDVDDAAGRRRSGDGPGIAGRGQGGRSAVPGDVTDVALPVLPETALGAADEPPADAGVERPPGVPDPVTGKAVASAGAPAEIATATVQ